MVFTLQRYIFRELLKVFVLTTIALTLILSLGSILRPIQQYGAGPKQVLYLICYFLPITLTFVLPISALFAASLVYGRFAADNELDACRASGISLLTLVYPGLVLAIIIAIANLILSFHVMPVFVHRAEKAIKADAKQMLFRTIQRKGYYKIPTDSTREFRIYADVTEPQNNRLSGLIIIELKDRQIKEIIAAKTADIYFNPHEGINEVLIIARKVYQLSSEDEGGFYFEKFPVKAEFGSLLGDDIKFKKIDQLKKIKHNPMNFAPIAKLTRQGLAQLTTELLAQDINSRITAAPDSHYRLRSDQRYIEFYTAGCTVSDERQIQLTGPVHLREYDAAGKKLVRTLQAQRGRVYIEGDEIAPTLTMELDNPVWRQSSGEEGLAATRLRIRGLIVPAQVTQSLDSTNLLETITSDIPDTVLTTGPSQEMVSLQDRLRKKIEKTLIEIEAEIHSRLVFGIGCVSMILIGIGLGIMLKDGHLLSAFGASVLPAAVLIICIIAGKNVTKNPGVQIASGVILMWAGLALTVLMVAAIYRKLLKN